MEMTTVDYLMVMETETKMVKLHINQRNILQPMEVTTEIKILVDIMVTSMALKIWDQEMVVETEAETLLL